MLLRMWVVQIPSHPPPSLGQRFLEGNEQIKDDVGLGRHPSLWWTMNCNYNCAYDVQRMNVTGEVGAAILDPDGNEHKEARFLFTRDNPDLVAYMLAFRTEALMRIVMPAVVPHSERHRYMTMSRFETGPGGNPHYHGVSVGTPGPQIGRVRADVAGGCDLPPDTLAMDVVIFMNALKRFQGQWEYDVILSEDAARDLVRRSLLDDSARLQEDVRDGSESGAEGSVDIDEDRPVDFLEHRICVVLKELVDRGELEIEHAGDVELPGPLS